METSLPSGTMWSNLARHRSTGVWKAPHLFLRLKGQLDISQFSPIRNRAVTAQRLASAKEEEYYILKNSAQNKYLRLTVRDFAIWQLMDGSRTVKDLVVFYFLSFGVLAFERVTSLVEQLKLEGFLEQPAAQLFTRLQQRLKLSTPEYKAKQLRKIFFHKTWEIKRIDNILNALYHGGVWLLFTRPAKLLYPLIAASGAVFFALVFQSGQYSVSQTAGSYVLALLTYLAINLASVIVHEGAHAFTVKSYGRKVPRAGFLFYFGLPSFFVDTSDIWLEPKARRIYTSWAGPYSSALFAGAFSFVLFFFPSFGLNPILFKAALFSYLSVLINLNPLLELDGYFMLMDWLEIPMLRAKALAFIRRQLLRKIFSRKQFARKEKLLAGFGALCALWTGITIFVSLYLLEWRIGRIFAELFKGTSWPIRTLSILTLALFVVPISLSLLSMAYLGLITTARAVARWTIWQQPKKLAPILAGLALALTLLSYLLFPESALRWGTVLEVLALAAAVFLAIVAGSDFSGSRQGIGISAISGFSGLLLASMVAGIIGMKEVLQLMAFVILFISALIIFAAYPRQWLSWWEKLIIAAALPTGLLFILILGRAGASRLLIIETYLALLSVTILVPILTNYRRTNFFYPWLFLLTAIPLLSLGSHWPHQAPALSTLGGVLLALGLLTLHLAWTHIPFELAPAPSQIVKSDRERLANTFDYLVNSLVEHFRTTFAPLKGRDLGVEFNKHARTRQPGFLLSKKGVGQHWRTRLDILEMGEDYRQDLSHLANLISRSTGEKYLHRATIAAYDRLYWEQRELANEYLFKELGWLDKLSHTFRERKETIEELLSRVHVFKGIGHDALSQIISILRIREFGNGEVAVKQGEIGNEFYIIRSGVFEVWLDSPDGRARKEATLRRGDYFGETALLKGIPRTATVISRADSKCLVIIKEDFDGLVKPRILAVQAISSSRQNLAMLRDLPLLSEFTNNQLAQISNQLKAEEYGPGQVILKQGERGEKFYIIRGGEVELTARSDLGAEIKVAELGPGECFGEIALFMDRPRTATVIASTPVELLSLAKSDFDSLLKTDLFVSRNLERMASRRLHDVKLKLRLAEGV
ncbi:MAG: cyclic nucleotide-binding domain-containing protein [Thermodesulfobacteriota bacterium]